MLVKWADWEGLPTWVELSYNLELKTYLTKNRANPHACTLIKNELRGQSETALDIYETDLYALRQAVFDSLSDVRYTPEGSVGRQTRVSIKVPFRKDEFDRTFGRVLRQKFGATGNDQCHATLEELNQVFGDAKWASRQYQTSTETFISPREFIHVSWGYKERLQYDHAECERYVYILVHI